MAGIEVAIALVASLARQLALQRSRNPLVAQFVQAGDHNDSNGNAQGLVSCRRSMIGSPSRSSAD